MRRGRWQVGRGAGRRARAEGGGRAGWPGPSAVWERGRGRVRESDAGCGAKQAGARALAGEREGAGRCGLVERPRKGNAGAGRAVVWAVRGERSGRQGFDLGHGFGCRLLCPAGWVLGFAFSISTPLSLFLIQTKFEFKYKFEFKPHSNI